jgi:hypothetical protein
MTDGGHPELLTAGQAAKLIDISRPNLDKWLGHRGIKPAAESGHPVGKLYDRKEIEAARDKWLEERDRESDEKRRAAALANSAK